MNALSRFCLAHPITTIMFVSGPALLGFVAFFSVPVGLMPSTAFPGLTVEVNYGGVGPEKIEEQITIPMEEAVSSVGGIEELRSVSEEGKARIDIEFTRGLDVNRKALEVRERIDPVAATFPREVQPPTVLRYDPEKRPVFIVALESEALDLFQQREFADRRVKKAFERVDGVSEIIVAGGQVREVLVSCDAGLLQSRGISMQEILRDLQSNNFDVALGRMHTNGGRYSVYGRGRFQSLEEIRNLILETTEDNRPILLRDVAEVKYSYRDQDTASRWNGEERISIYVHKGSEANLLVLSDELRRAMQEVHRDDVDFRMIYDQADTIRSAVGNLLIAGAVGLLFAALLLYFAFFSLRISLVVLGALPVSFLISSFAIFLVGFEYNLMTISGFILSAGVSLTLLTVTVLAIRRFGPTAAGERVGQELIAGVLVLGAIFVPVLFSGEELKILYGGFAVAVAVPAAVTLLLCFTIVPVLLGRREFRRYQFAPFRKGADTLRRSLWKWKQRFDGAAYRAYPNRIRGWFIALQRTGWRGVAAYFVILVLGAVVFSFSKQQLGSSFEKNRVNSFIEFPSGTAFGPTNGTSKKVEEKLLKVEGVKEISSRVEAGRSTLRLTLEDGQDASPAYIETLKEAAGNNEPAFVFFSTEADAGALREITIHVLGEDLETLDKLTKNMANLAKTYEGVNEVVLRYKSPRPELRLWIDRVKAQRVGLTAADFGQNVRFAIQGGVATKFIEENREIDVRIRYDEKFRRSLEQLADYFLKAGEGRFVPMLELVRQEEGTVPVKIYRKNKKRTYSFSLQLGDAGYETLTPRLDELQAAELPANYRIEFGRELRIALESRQRFYRVIALSVLLVYMILAAYFESLRRPFLLLVPLPLPIIAAATALFIFRIPLSITILIGFLILAAWVALQAMLLRTPELAAMQQDRRAMAKLFLAACATAVFYLPFTVVTGDGGEFLRGISISVIAGLAASTLATPLLVAVTARIPVSELLRLRMIQAWSMEMFQWIRRRMGKLR